MFDLHGKTAIVLGGASGIGEATVRTMCELGGAVVIADVDREGAETGAATLATQGLQCAFCHTDIMDETSIAGVMNFTQERFGGIDILVNSAGIPRTVAPDCEVIDMPLDWWTTTITGHLTGSMLACKHVLPHMIARGGGSIVNISSLAGFLATVNQAAYSAAKAGVHQLCREVAATYGRDNIRCNTVVPGLVLTPRGRATFTPEMVALFAEETPLPRIAVAQDLANAVVFLASDAASMITGQTLTVDGGMTSKLPYWRSKLQGKNPDKFAKTTFKLEAGS